MKKLFVLLVMALLSSCVQINNGYDDGTLMSHKVRNSELNELCRLLRSNSQDPKMITLILSEFNQRNISYTYCYTHGSNNSKQQNYAMLERLW